MSRRTTTRLGTPRQHYVDDGRAGDDFLTRTGLRQLLADAQRGDVIICRWAEIRPQSRRLSSHTQ